MWPLSSSGGGEGKALVASLIFFLEWMTLRIRFLFVKRISLFILGNLQARKVAHRNSFTKIFFFKLLSFHIPVTDRHGHCRTTLRLAAAGHTGLLFYFTSFLFSFFYYITQDILRFSLQSHFLGPRGRAKIASFTFLARRVEEFNFNWFSFKLK